MKFRVIFKKEKENIKIDFDIITKVACIFTWINQVTHSRRQFRIRNTNN